MKRWVGLGLLLLGVCPAACGSPTRTFRNSGGAGGEDTGGHGPIGGFGGMSGSPDGDDAGSGGDLSGAGDGGSGEAGAPPAKACDHNDDCDDQLACNGTETCVDGTCSPGTKVTCPNADTANCEGVCTEGMGAAICTVQGRDKDKDGHRSALCASNKGDDCNDSSAQVYPGAAEVCDRLDNDCDSKIDVNDDLPLGGSTVTIGPTVSDLDIYYPSVAWASDSSVYGVGRPTSNTGPNLFAELRNQAGTATVSSILLGQNGRLVLAGSGTLGAAYSYGGNGAYFRVISPSNGALSAEARVGTEAYASTIGVARLKGGTWAVLYSWVNVSNGSHGGKVQRFTPAGNVADTAIDVVSGTLDSGGIAATDTSFIVVHSAGGAANAHLWAPNFSFQSTLQISGASAVVGAGSDAFAIATSTPGSAPQINLFSTNGAKLCGPVDFADKTFVPSSIAATSKGYVVISTTTQVQEIASDCSSGEHFTIDTGTASAAQIAAGSNGFGVTWLSSLMPKFRSFGPDFCN